jgi:hypothetical protein
MEDSEVTPVERLKLSKPRLLLFICSTISILVIILSKNPGEGGPVLILAFLLVLFIWLFSLISVVYRLVIRILSLKKPSAVRELYTGVSLSAGLVFLVGLQTLSQLQLADVVLVGVFELLLNFYLLRRF